MQINFETPVTNHSIEAELMSYIEQHPNAADTAEGIRQWWLIKRIAEYSKDIIQTSLDELVESQVLKTTPRGNGDVIYGLNRQ